MLSTPAAGGAKPSKSGWRLNDSRQDVDLAIPTQIRLPNGAESAINGTLRRVDEGFFRLQLRRRFPLGTRLQVLFRGEFVTCEVICCRMEGDGFSVDATVSSFRPLRSQMRFPVDIPALVRLPDTGTSFKVRIVDVSSSGLGLGLHSPIEINVGTIVAVEFARGTFFGEVRHCTQKNGYFHAGLASSIHPD